jgi:MinD superfamily P-loop ATPase
LQKDKRCHEENTHHGGGREAKMRIAVLSGKGGTGKTFVSTNLAAAIGDSTYLDCDIEEPNGYLFLKPKMEKSWKVTVPVPNFDPDKCSGCRKCVQFCQYNALAFIKGKPRLFPEICHSCGGCALICPNGAITETKREIGIIEQGQTDGVAVLTGILGNGEATGVPIIRELIRSASKTGNVIIDCPPGSACSAMESIRSADYCLLAAEPTRFGLSNLELVTRLVALFEKPCGIVVNKDIGGKDLIGDFATAQKIPLLCRIPFDAQLGALIAQGMLAVKEECYKEMFLNLYNGILETAGGVK